MAADDVDEAPHLRLPEVDDSEFFVYQAFFKRGMLIARVKFQGEMGHFYQMLTAA